MVIGGIATNVCCETTAREAMQHDIKVIFLSDGTTTFELPGSLLGADTTEEIQRVIAQRQTRRRFEYETHGKDDARRKASPARKWSSMVARWLRKPVVVWGPRMKASTVSRVRSSTTAQ